MSKTRIAARAAGIAAAVALLGAITAGSATAQTTGTFSPTGDIDVTGSLTWTVEGNPPITCPVDTVTASASVDMLDVTFADNACATGYFSDVRLWFFPYVDGADRTLQTGSWSSFLIPANGVTELAYFDSLGGNDEIWTNGDQDTPSTIEFTGENRTATIQVGDNYGDPIYVEGTLEVTTATGGLVTMN